MKAVALVVKLLSGAGVFVGAGAGWLAFQGRLDSETLSQLPGLSSLKHESPADEGGGEEKPAPGAGGETPDPHASEGGPGTEAAKGARSGGESGAKPAPDHAAAGGERKPATGASSPVPILPEPFSATEVNEMLRASGRAREEYESRSTLLDERERALARAERDLDERRREIESLMGRFSELQESLASDRSKFERDVVRVQEAEQGNVKKLASLYEGMPDTAAATALAQVDVTTAAKILAAMQKRKAGKVLGAMPAALAAEVSDKMTRILDDTRETPGGTAPNKGGGNNSSPKAAPPEGKPRPASDSPDTPAEK